VSSLLCLPVLAHNIITMRFTIASVFVFCIAAVSGKSLRSSGQLIVGGEDAKIGEIPYQISLRYAGSSHRCGGSIIDKKWVLTAAHCVDSGGSLEILAGQTILSDSNSGTPQTVKVDTVFIHPNYTRAHFAEPYIDGDIALLKLSSEVAQNEHVKTIEYAPFGYLASEEMLVTGWGSKGKVDHLQKVTLPFVTDEVCNDCYGPDYLIPDSQICAGDVNNGGIDSCQGDSGGPLVEVTSGYVVGIVSWGRGCALAGYPGVNTEVSYFADWIDETLKANK